VQHKHTILIVEDSDEDFYATERILKKFTVGLVERCSNATEVMPRLEERNTIGAGVTSAEPSLILLDLNLPGKRDGRSILTDLKNDNRYRCIPVVIMTTSSNPSDVHHCFNHGAAGYIVKPVNFDKFVQSVECLVRYWFETVTLPSKVEENA